MFKEEYMTGNIYFLIDGFIYLQEDYGKAVLTAAADKAVRPLHFY